MSTSARSSARTQSGSARRLRVLVADDNKRLAAMVSTTLMQAGHVAVVVHDGYSALALAGEQHFDALLTDLQMPGLSGDVVAERVRRIRPELPVLLMTASDDGVFLGQPWSAVIRKPFALDALVATVERAATSGRSPRVIPGTPLPHEHRYPDQDQCATDDSPLTVTTHSGSVQHIRALGDPDSPDETQHATDDSSSHVTSDLAVYRQPPSPEL
jgi:CheY-like chemotaxis protein